MAEGSRSRRRRSRSKKNKPSKRWIALLRNLGWIAVAAVIGLPLLALALNILH